ncbi:hypothetical protein OG455_38805 [Kitasatospora sp. NBC_01287]|uniref:hypothetical protein n=1 Tax=Kitasatospora sp. NBC_01287 TaxID=2903573 RepID=UPI00225A0644|nr:hypothetical protein [Kitasatospora sp. NBC_01287]MCX4751388.1 hypothetical protein [Kitasatospora sp. NBC_01287]
MEREQGREQERAREHERRQGPRAADPVGGEPACLLHLVCAECGALAEERPPTVCRRCGSAIEPG